MRFQTQILHLFAMLALCGVPAAAQAATELPHLTVNFRDYVIYDSNTNYVAGNIVGEHSEVDYHDGRALVTDGKGRADYGSLGISSFAATKNNGNGDPIVYNSEIVIASSWELFNIGGSQPIGTPVTLTFTGIVHIAADGTVATPFASQFLPCPTGPLSCAPTGTAVAAGGLPSHIDAGFSFYFDNNALDPANCLQFAGSTCNAPLTVGMNTLTVTRLAHVGDTLALRTYLAADTSQYHPVTYATGFASSGFFALNTARTYLSVSSPDVVVTAQSGHDYTLSAVPEPASWTMLLSGFGCVGAALRRARRTAPMAG